MFSLFISSFSLMYIFDIFFKNSGGYSCVDLYLSPLFYFVDPCIYIVRIPCFFIIIIALQYNLKSSMVILFLFRISLTILVFPASTKVLRLF